MYTSSYDYMTFFFFFQAEDGIRDYKVTGVQTCALPISQPAPRRPGRDLARPPGPAGGERPGLAQPREPGLCGRGPGLRPAGQCRLQWAPTRGGGALPGVPEERPPAGR